MRYGKQRFIVYNYDGTRRSASIIWIYDSHNDLIKKVHCDSNGRAEWDGMDPSVEYKFIISNSHFVEFIGEFHDYESAVDQKLVYAHLGKRIFFVVRDEYGRLVENATVTITGPDGLDLSGTTNEVGAIGFTTDDIGGELLRDEYYYVTVEKDGYVNKSEAIKARGADPTPWSGKNVTTLSAYFNLEKDVCTTTLEIEDSLSSPIDDAEVEVYLDDELFYSGTTNTDGEFPFGIEFTDGFTYNVYADGFERMYEQSISDSVRCSGVSVTMSSGNFPTWEVEDGTTSSPIENAKISIYDIDSGETEEGLTSVSGDYTGYKLDYTSGEFLYFVEKDGYIPKSSTVDSSSFPVNIPVNLFPIVDETQFLSFDVEDGSGTKISDALISVYESGSGSLIEEGLTNTDGFFEAVFSPSGYLPSTSYDYEVSKEGYITGSGSAVTTPSGLPSETITLEEEEILEETVIHVTDADGDPISSATVNIYDFDTHVLQRSYESNDDGYVAVDVYELEYGDKYIVKAQKSGYTTESVGFIHDGSTYHLVLESASVPVIKALTFNVNDLYTGEALDNAHVVLTKHDADDIVAVGDTSDGFVTFSNIETGMYDLKIQRKYYNKYNETISVSSTSSSYSINLEPIQTFTPVRFGIVTDVNSNINANKITLQVIDKDDGTIYYNGDVCDTYDSSDTSIDEETGVVVPLPPEAEIKTKVLENGSEIDNWYPYEIVVPDDGNITIYAMESNSIEAKVYDGNYPDQQVYDMNVNIEKGSFSKSIKGSVPSPTITKLDKNLYQISNLYTLYPYDFSGSSPHYLIDHKVDKLNISDSKYHVPATERDAPTTLVKMTIVDINGKKVSGAKVNVTPLNKVKSNIHHIRSAESKQETTDANGRCNFFVVQDNIVEIHIPDLNTKVQRYIGTKDQEFITIEADGTGYITVKYQLLDGSDNPISGASVWITEDSDGSKVIGNPEISGSKGWVEFQISTTKDTVYIWATHPDHDFSNPTSYTI